MKRNERVILKTFGFIVSLEHPHKFVLSYAHTLDGKEDLMQESWNILNDRCELGLFYQCSVLLVHPKWAQMGQSPYHETFEWE
jgi:hypothetical protein